MATLKNMYLAAPFFTSAESRVINQIEDVFSKPGVSVRYRLHSPRRDSGTCDVTSAPERKRFFHATAAAIDKSAAVLVWVERCPERPNPAAMADLCSVWSAGYAFSKGIPVYLFSRTREVTIPVLLSECAEGMVFGMTRLDYLISSVPFRSWKGELDSMNRQDAMALKGVAVPDDSTRC